MKLNCKIAAATTAIIGATLLAGCTSQADTVSQNLSTEADSFKVQRQVVFFNGITDKYLLVITGLCSLGNHDSAKEITVTCKTGPNSYKKHFLGLSDNVSYFAEQLDPVESDPFHYEIVFKPEEIVPDIKLQTSANQ